MSGGAFSRNKGATFEREVAQALRDYTGIKFERNLEQVRTRHQGDLIADDPAWPFVIECKRAAGPCGRMMQWRRQAMAAARSTIIRGGHGRYRSSEAIGTFCLAISASAATRGGSLADPRRQRIG